MNIDEEERQRILLWKNPNPTADEVLRELDQNLCRCTGYHSIVDAVLLAAQRMREQTQ